ncbi:MAG: DUF2231 domain-containing protein [Bacteroidales bacterium]|jgi:uncharacterized membrane protein|nr:DUF2231 domain-containing protein [Bacteroidales bacterium]
MNSVTFHPMVVHFSVALVIVGFVIDLFYIFIAKKDWRKTSSLFLMILAVLAVFFSWFTGEYYSRSYDGVGRDVKDEHELFAWITMGVFGAATAVRFIAIYLKKNPAFFKYLYIVLMLSAVMAIGYCGYLGGNLVYELQHDLRPGQ